MQTQPCHGDCCQGDNIKEQPSLIRIPSEKGKERERERERGESRRKREEDRVKKRKLQCEMRQDERKRDAGKETERCVRHTVMRYRKGSTDRLSNTYALGRVLQVFVCGDINRVA